MISVKRVYDEKTGSDGSSYLVDRLWPCGISKEKLKNSGWLKEAAPTDELRHWFNHEPEKWTEFKKRYFAELEKEPESWQPLLEAAKKGDIILLYSAKEEQYNNAVALKDFLESKLKKRGV